MSMYSKQKIFCNCCGKELFTELPNMYGKYRVCSTLCGNEMEWRHLLSILGKEYKEDKVVDKL